MNWRKFAEEVQREEGGDNRDNRDDSPETEPIVPNVPTVPLDPARALRQWRAGLAKVDPHTVPEGWTVNRWRGLTDDAEYLIDEFGEQLAQEGWSSTDVFGVSLRRENGEVLLDRLQGARNLRLDGEGRAFWSRYGVTFITCRGAAPAGMLAIWEIG